MRITGLATGLDMDKIVSDSMKPYRMRIDQTQQKRDIIEMKQMLYRDVISDSRELYNKYFDVSKPDSLLLSSNYGVTKFTSSNDSVLSVKGGADAKAGSYTITGTTGKAAKAIVTENIEEGKEIVINGQKFTLKGTTEKEIAANLNENLKEKKIDISVRYSDFAGSGSGVNKSGLIFESTVLGADNTFTIGGKFKPVVGGVVDGTDATATKVSGFNVTDFKPSGGKLFVNGEEINIEVNSIHTNEDIEKIIQSKITDKKLSVKIDDKGEITFTSTVLGAVDPKITMVGVTERIDLGVEGTNTTNTIDMNSIIGKKISINGQVIDLSKAAGNEVVYLNKVLKDKGIEASLDNTDISNPKLILRSQTEGADSKIDLELFDGNSSATVEDGSNTAIRFVDSNGGIYDYTGNSNTVTLDGITFKFTGEIPAGTSITVNGKTDTKDTKDKLVKFVEDYNVLMEKLNKMTMEKPNKKYQPLTEEQKKEMSESEVKLWNEKVKQGQLSRDSDITRLSNSMKSIMSSVSGKLEKIGITPSTDYQGTKHGTLKIDESKLDMALENSAEDVMNLLIGTKKDSTGKETKGVLHQLKDVIYNETVTVTSSLIKKAGIDNSATSSNNDLTRTIEKYNKKMVDLEKDFKRREQALYSKYARLEVSMNQYNSQQSMMAQQFGGQ